MSFALTPISRNEVVGIDEWLSACDLGEFMNGWKPRSVREGNWHPELCRWEFIEVGNHRVGTVWLERRAIGDPSADLGILIAEHRDRGKGIGTETIRRVEADANQMWGTTMIRLRVRILNTKAIACYERLGFVATKTTTRTNGDSEITVLHMEHRLDGANSLLKKTITPRIE